MFALRTWSSTCIHMTVHNQQSMSITSFVRKLKRVTGGGLNTHRSNKAKEGLYHGKDIRFGNTISHSHAKTRRSWHPNAFKKRVWSFALNDWVRFNMTAAAMKAIDDIGGIDNYILGLDERSVQDSWKISTVRDKIAAVKFHAGTLDPRLVKRFGYHKNPPPLSFPKEVEETDTKLPKSNQSV